MVLCCKDSTIFSLSPHLCATDFLDKEHSHDFLLFFRSSSPLSVLTLVASRPAHLTFRPFLLAFVKATAHLLRKTRELFGKTPQLLAKSSLVFLDSRAPFHLLNALSAQIPPFSQKSILLFPTMPLRPHNISQEESKTLRIHLPICLLYHFLSHTRAYFLSASVPQRASALLKPSL